MSKRKEPTDEVEAERVEDEEWESDEDIVEGAILNYDFETDDPKEIDFHAIKNFLKNLFDVDADQFDLSKITELILENETWGLTIKIADDEDQDPFYFFSVLDAQSRRSIPAFKAILNYYCQKTAKKPEFTRKLRQILSSQSKEKVALILSERMLNFPVEANTNVFKHYLESAKEADEVFDYYIIVSRTFTEEASEIDKEDQPAAKRKTLGKFNAGKTYYPFHPEDDCIHDTCEYYTSFSFNNQNAQQSDAKRAFQDQGILSHGHIMLLPGKNLEKTVENLMQIAPY